MHVRVATIAVPLVLAFVGCQAPNPMGAPTDKPALQAMPSGPPPSAKTPAPAPSFAGGDGTSFDAAVVVIAANEFVGVRAEYSWLREHFPGYRRTSQALVHRGAKAYDVLDIESPTGTRTKVYFDITPYFGKL